MNQASLTKDQTDALARLFADCHADPELFIRGVLRVPRLRRWQVRACAEIRTKLLRGETRIKLTIRTCHGAGKTFFAGCLLLWVMFTRQNARGLTTAPTWAGVENLLWPAIAGLWNRSILRALAFGRVLATKIEITRDWFAVGASSDHPENLEGHHSERSAIRIIDEAKAVDPAVFEATDGMLNAPEAFDLWISTPSIETGNFFDRDMGTDASVIRLVVDVDELISDPNLTDEEREGYRAWKAERLQEWGEASAEYQSRVLARYIDNAEGALFPSTWIDRAMKATFVSGNPENPGSESWPKTAGMDVAGSTDGDQNAVAVVASKDDRVEVFSLDAWHERNTMKSAGRLYAILKRPGNRGTVPRVDTIGLGKGVCDHAAAEEYRSSDRANDKDRFTNRKAEDAWTLRRRLEGGRVATGRLPEKVKRALAAELRKMRYEILQTGKVRVIDPKDSPDLVDAVLIAQAPSRRGWRTSRVEWAE